MDEKIKEIIEEPVEIEIQEEIVEEKKQINVRIMVPTFEINGLFN